MPPPASPATESAFVQPQRRTVTTLRMQGDALPLWWKLLVNLVVVALGAAVLSVLAVALSHDRASEPAVVLRAALWDGQAHAPAVAVLLGVAAAALVPLVARFPRGRARREVRLDAGGVEFVKHRKWWFRGRSGRISWDEVQTISAWQAPFLEPRLGRGSRHLLRPVLDIYLHQRDVYLPDWVETTTVRRTHLDGLELPATRLRVGGPSSAMEQSLRTLAAALGRMRAELFYQGTDVDQWFTPPANRTVPFPVALGVGEDSDTLPMRRGQAPSPVWLCHTMARTRWVLGALALATGLALAGTATLSFWEQPWAVGVSLAAALVLFPALVSWVVFAPWKLAQQGLGVDEVGLYVLRVPMWWAGQRLWFAAQWDQVLAAVARRVPAGGVFGRGRTRRVVDVYVSGQVPTDLGNRIAVSRHDEPDGPQMGSLAAFPVTRLRLDYRRSRELVALRWGRGWRGAPEVRRLSRNQLRPTLLHVHSEICTGFADVLPDLEPGRRWWHRWFGPPTSLAGQNQQDNAAAAPEHS